MLKTLNTQSLVAKRIFDYYLQIIEIKKQQNIKNFWIDAIPLSACDKTYSLVYLEDKYDGKSNWRQYLGITDEDNWHTLPGSFREAFGDTDTYYVNIEDTLKEVSMMLLKHGVANYFEAAVKGSEVEKRFAIENQMVLYVVL